MRQEPADISLDSLLRALERHYALHAAPIFRANGIPEPPRLPDPALPEPANEVVQGFRSLERSGRHGARNAVRAPEGANPEKYLPVPASWLPSRIIWPLEITLSRLAQGRGVVEMLMPKYGNDLAFFLRLRTSDITGYNFNCSLMRSAALNAQRFSWRIGANTIS